ncbi:MAG: PAS domain-containing protein [Nitrospirae bacterium]|nr:PAS domain-containing protein [Nitrospirota bacterium]
MQAKIQRSKFKGQIKTEKLQERLNYKGIIQNMNTCVIITDESRIIYLNDAAAKTLGYRKRSLVGRDLTSLFPVKEKRHFTISDFLTIRDKTMPRNELDFVTKDKKVIPIGFTVTPFYDSKTKSSASILTFRDLTEIKKMENYMRQIDRLSILSQITAGLAHEIKNPLAGIKTSAQVLEEGMKIDDPRYQLTVRIAKEADRIDNLLKKFFNFAKPSEPHSANYDIEMIIDGVYLLLAHQFKNNRVSFKKDFSKRVPQVFVDENQVEQVLMNVFLNALQAMPGGGIVSVRTDTNAVYEEDGTGLGESRIKGTKDGKEPVVYVEIKDTGTGISKENLERIFTPFFSTKKEGTGLGLSICRQLMLKNNGEIDIKSEEGRGAAVILSLPASLNY